MSSADEQLRELERQVQREPGNHGIVQQLATEYHRRGQLEQAIQTLLDINQFNETNPCAQSIGQELRSLQREILKDIEGLYHFHGFFDSKKRVRWRYRGPDDSAIEKFSEPVLGLGNLSFGDCERLRTNSEADLWLHSLALNERHPRNDIFDWIVALPFLHGLELEFNCYNASHHQLLRQCSHLKHLNLVLKGSLNCSELFDSETALDSLVRFSYSGEAPEAGVDFRGLKELRDLHLRFNNDSNHSLPILLPKSLKSLAVAASNLCDSKTVEALSQLTELRSLSLDYLPAHRLDGSFFTGLKSLESLTCYGAIDRDLRLLPHPEQLTSLIIHIEDMQPSLIETLVRFEQLRELCFGINIDLLQGLDGNSEFNSYIAEIVERLPLIYDISIEALW